MDTTFYPPRIPLRARKKFPACDNCKARRVLCHSQPPGVPCPRCCEKGIACTTTPTIRRRRRTKAELQRARAEAEAASQDEGGSNAASTSSTTDMDSIVPALRRLIQREVLPRPTLASPTLDLPASLVSGLFRTFCNLPQFHHPIIPIARIETTLQRSCWQLSALPPQDRVLVQCILAVSSLSSMDSHIIGSLEHRDFLARSPQKADLREYGRRREHICQQLRGEAVRLAIQEGITVHVSQENAASCSLLGFLEYRATGQGMAPYVIAYNAHIRSMQEGSETPVFSLDSSDVIKWPSFFMQDALCALSSGKYLPFTKQDELLLCGEESCSIEQAMKTLLSEQTKAMQIFSTMRPLCLHVIHLARKCSEHLTGAYARRQSLDEVALMTYLASLETFHAAVKALKSRTDALIPLQDEDGAEALQICTFIMVISWTSLVLALYNELERRYSTSSASSLAEISNDGVDWSRARLELHYKQVRGMTLKVSVELAEVLANVPTIGHLTHLTFGDVDKWARLLLKTTECTEITQMERVQTLEQFRDALKLAGFSLVDRTGLVESIEPHLVNVVSEPEQRFSFSAMQCSSSSSTTVDDSPTPSMSLLLGPNVFLDSLSYTMLDP